jgi:hypothetical protein
LAYRQLAEGASELIIKYIREGIGVYLDQVAGEFALPSVTLENPKEYFIYEKSKGLMTPAVFVICDQIDFRIKENKSNFVNASDKFRISVLIEDQTEAGLTRKAWRYQSALHSLLDLANIVSPDQTLSLNVVVYRATFSPVFMRESTPGTGGKFRKEIVLECEVEHYEKF